MIETETKKKVTLEEFMQYPEVNIELINGNIFHEPTPTYGHQSIVGELLVAIKIQLRINKAGEIVVAPIDVFLDDNVVQPDLLFIATERLNIIVDGKIKGTPDVVFEIISPSNAYRDTKEKFDIYERFGVKEYFIVYPDDKTVVKYILTNGKFHEEYREIGFVKSEAMSCEVNL